MTIKYFTFVNSQDEVLAALIAVRSLSLVEPDADISVLTPESCVADIEADFPDWKLRQDFQSAGAKLVPSFTGGYNASRGFRVVLNNMARRCEGDDALVYFAPQMIFRVEPNLIMSEQDHSAAFAPDDFWPKLDLYGPNLNEIWKAVANLGQCELDDWLSKRQPDGYWRRYPNAWPGFFQTRNPAAFSSCYEDLTAEVKKATPMVFAGQGNTFPEALLTASLMRLNGRIFKPDWDETLIAYHDFYGLIMRLSELTHEWFANEILDFPPIRKSLKQFREYQLIFYQKRLTGTRVQFDNVERNFSINRMEKLIDKRNLRRNTRQRIKRELAEEALAKKAGA